MTGTKRKSRARQPDPRVKVLEDFLQEAGWSTRARIQRGGKRLTILEASKPFRTGHHLASLWVDDKDAIVVAESPRIVEPLLRAAGLGKWMAATERGGTTMSKDEFERAAEGLPVLPAHDLSADVVAVEPITGDYWRSGARQRCIVRKGRRFFVANYD